MKRFGAAMFGTLQLLSTIALVQVAAAPVSKWPAAELAERTVERRAVEAVFLGACRTGCGGVACRTAGRRSLRFNFDEDITRPRMAGSVDSCIRVLV